MQSFQMTGLPAQGPKNYVFVDEHNRHKRLKVMRACEGCRRRKIKCDAATTNSWPCAACKRLKLTCVPPAGGADGEPNAFEATDEALLQTDPSSQHYSSTQLHYLHNYGTQAEMHPNFSYDPATSAPQNSYTQQDFQYAQLMHESQLSAPQPDVYSQHRYPSFDSTNGHDPSQNVGSPQSADSVTAEELAENLGVLRIGESGIAPYIRQQNESQKEAPAPILDEEDDFSAFPIMAGSQVRIPPALMPSDEDAYTAFSDFFQHVHPYVPVLCKSHFYHQWQTERESISPLLLETILACAGQVSGDPAGGSQWLALANRHEQSFVDTPRLSTIQALLLLLKAREKTPRRGYFYRSWILVKKIVGMAKDLDLHEHFEAHESGGSCGSAPAECLAKTRVWQITMIVELMVGGPQGRSDYGIDIDTVDVSPCPPNSQMDEHETNLSKEFAYWVRNVRNIRGMTETYHKLKRKNADWANDPKFLAYNTDFKKWPADLPDQYKISIPADKSLPVIPSHFLANMHCHYQLGIVMLYKPQLNASKDFAHDEKWKHMMSVCYNSAKKVCILQEATLKKFDILGLAAMQRGLSFPIYAILSCVMIHLIAVTHPDPSLNQDAREYFARHMRVLEQCIAEWPMPEVEEQIRGLRAAFSADLTKPFDLKPTFPYGTPSEPSKSPEERRSSEPQQQYQPQPDYAPHHQHVPQGHYFPTPPVSAGGGTKPHTPQYHQDYPTDHTSHQFQQMPPTSHPNTTMTPTELWNPTPIIDQFNTAFAIPQSALVPPSSSYSSSPPVTIPQQSFHPQPLQQQYMHSPVSAGGYNGHAYTPSPTSQSMPNPQTFIPPQSQTTPQPQMTPNHYPQQQAVTSYFDPSMNQAGQPQVQNSMPANQVYTGNNGSFHASPTSAGPNQPVYVTPKEWQQSVASVFDPSGLKRKWGYDQQSGMQQPRQAPRHYGNMG